MAKLPKRSSKYSVGKEIGGAIYLHRCYESVLPAVVQECKQRIVEDLNYTIVKYSKIAETVSFIECPDFDSADEPEVGALITVGFNGFIKLRRRLADPYIYHHKWLFVREDYDGFDVQESRERSRLWLNLPNVDKRRIGRKSYWNKHVVPRIDCKPMPTRYRFRQDTA